MPSKEQWSSALTALAALMCIFMGFLLGRVCHPEADVSFERGVCAFDSETVTGFVTLSARRDGRVFLYGRLQGPEGLHGLHVHDFGNLGDGCRATGNHFNPLGRVHGSPDAEEKHAGDMGNINFTNRTALLKIETNSISLSGMMSVIGRSLVVHQRRDDLGLGGHPASQVNGAAGERLACCVIAVDRDTNL